MVVFGLAAAGKAGNAVSAGVVVVDDDNVANTGGREFGRDDGRDEEEWLVDGPSHAAALRPALPALVDDDDAAGIGGNGFAVAALPQLPCLLTADREDCAVEFFSFNTRWPPLPAPAAEDPGSTPLGPGSDG